MKSTRTILTSSAIVALAALLIASLIPLAASAMDCQGGGCTCCQPSAADGPLMTRPGCCEVAPVEPQLPAPASTLVEAPEAPSEFNAESASVVRGDGQTSTIWQAANRAVPPPPASFLLHCAFLI